MRTLKIETQIKNQMENFLSTNGVKDTDITIDGNHYFLVAPNRFGQGYIKLVSSTNGVWDADLSKTDPTKAIHVKQVTWNVQA